MKSPVIDLLSILEERGHRATGPRMELLSLIERKTNGFTAEAISDALPKVGRATVFRTLRLLQDIGVVCKLTIPGGVPVYAVARIGHHHHTLCVRCGTVGEFQDVTIEKLMDGLDSEISGEIVGHRIELYVTCEICLGRLQF